ncbi:hypothetical protein B0A54_15041 [Friedmanniomyces endolithicus]|uniref:DUF1772 domain-containing protein n=1 Tax=Friedmanniomyces endolithicus TaxID=329885 RepID=A0A4U0U6U2_9PEZI|nr:hypothetical protein LTS09_004869 [Friedmanniomyces endolithicus]TKA29915.1 hypothetical protein B0A54_15041 [Friedmanniomyces endolithicus]
MAALTNKSLFYTEELGSMIRVAQVLGLTSTAFLAGKVFASSFTAVPAMLHAPAPLLAKQFKTVFDSDIYVNSIASVVATGVFSFFAYRDPNPGSRHQVLYTTAAALIAAAVPYSFIFLHPISRQLLQRANDLANTSLTDTAAESGIAKEETTHVLVDRWATLNLGRSLLCCVAALSATWAAVDRLEVVPAVGKIVGGANRMGH